MFLHDNTATFEYEFKLYLILSGVIYKSQSD